MGGSNLLGLLFSTRIGLTDVQQYGWTYDSAEQCGLPAARIWKLTRVNVSKAITGYLSTIDTSTPDCTRARLDDRETEPDRIYYTAEDVTATQRAYLDSMSMPITPASPTQIVQTFNAPADGDIANAASVNVGFQALENSVEALRYLTYGGGFYPRVKATSNTVMTIQPLGAVIVKQLGVWTAVPHTVATTIDPLALAGGAFAANTRYYVYVNLVAGVITWSVSTTAADAGWRYKAGDEQYQFVTTFYTNSVPNLLPYSQSGKRFDYIDRTSAGGVRGNLLLDAGASLVLVAFNTTGGAIPTNATEYTLGLYAETSVGTGRAVVKRTNGVPTDITLDCPAVAEAAGLFTWSGDWSTVKYYVSTANTALTAWALSFTI